MKGVAHKNGEEGEELDELEECPRASFSSWLCSVISDAGAVVGAAGTIQRLAEQLNVQLGLHASLQFHGEVLQRERERKTGE